MSLRGITDQFPVIDGFTYNSLLKFDLSFLPLALQEYDALRRSGCMRTKMWCVPRDANTFVIPAFDNFKQQVSMKPGSAIWGYTFVGNFGAEGGNLAVQVTDACDDVALFSEDVTRQFALQNSPGFWAPQQAFARLLVVGPPGLLNVVISNTFPTAQIAQVILYGGEPVT